MYNDPDAWHQYLVDRENAQMSFYFDWNLVLEEVMPLVNDKTVEYIGIIRARDDKKTLYVHKIESSNSNERVSNSYVRSVPVELVKKYSAIPGYFMFHTHPAGVNADPMPSDVDLYMAIVNTPYRQFMGEIVIGEYGIIVYYLNNIRFDNILKQGSKLAFYTYCYDVIMAWNSINSMTVIRLQDRLLMAEKYGITMLIVPSPLYISDNHFKEFVPKILYDRFIKTKYELLDHIKETIKAEERIENEQLLETRKNIKRNKYQVVK